MGHSKLPWRAESTNDSDGNLQFIIISSAGCVVAKTNRPAGFSDEDITAIKDLIITAVNMMPEVIEFLLTVKAYMEAATPDDPIVIHANKLLKKLEAVDVS